MRLRKHGKRLRKILRAPSTSCESHSYKVVSLANASSDDISPSIVARFIVEAIYTLCLDGKSSLRIHPSKVSVGSNGDWDLGLIHCDIGHARDRDPERDQIRDRILGHDRDQILKRDQINPGAQLRVDPYWGSLEGIEFTPKYVWNLLKLEELLKDYIQRSRLRLWLEVNDRRSPFRSQQRRSLYGVQHWLICLVEMRFCIQRTREQSHKMVECYRELDVLEQSTYKLSEVD